MVDNEKWFTSIPVVYTDQKVFTGLEHMILSQQKSLLVLHNKHLNHNQQSPHSQHHHHHQNHGSQAHFGSKVGSHDHHHHHGSRANLTSNPSLHNHSSTSVGQTAAAIHGHHHQGHGGGHGHPPHQSSHSQFVPQPPAGTAAPPHRGLNRLSTIATSSVGGGGLGGGGTSFHPLQGKLELFGIMDYGSILSWMIDSAPSIVLKELKKQQKFIRSKRLSFEFSLKQEFMSQDSSLDSYDGGEVGVGAGEGEEGGGGGDVLDISPTNRRGLELMMDFDHHGDGGGGGGSDEEDTYYDQGFHEVDEDHDSNLLHHVIEEGNENAESPAFKPRTSKVILSTRKSTMKGGGGKAPAGRPSAIVTDASQGNLRQGSRASLLPVHSKQQLHQSSTASLNNNGGGYSQRNRSIQMTSSTLKNNKWQNMGDLVANSNIEKIFYTKNFASFHQKYDVNNILTNDQYLYNLILLAAKGHRHLPVSVEANNFYKIFHIISSQEIADFLFENCQDIFSNLNQPTGLPNQPDQQVYNNSNNQSYSQSRQSQRSTSPLERRSASPTHRPPTNSGGTRPQTNSSSSGGNSNKNKLIDRPVVWTGLMRKPSVVSTLMIPKEPKEYQNSLLAFRSRLASKSTDENREASNTSPVPQQSQQQQASKTKIRYNLGSIFYQLLQSNLDSILVTNEKNKVISVVSIHLIQDFWWAWKKRNLFEAYPNKPSLEDLIKEYELGTYQLYEDDENVQTSGAANVGPITTAINAGTMMHSGSASLLNNNNPMLKRLTTNNTSATPQAHHPSTTAGFSHAPPSTTPHSSYQRHSSTGSTSGFSAPVLPSPAVGSSSSKFSFSNYNTNESTNATTPYPFQQNVNSAIANNVNISKYNFTFFSILMNYIDQCQDLLNITVLDLEECLKDPEEERELLLKLQKEQERLLSRQKSPKGSKKSPNKFDEAAQNANKDQSTTAGITSHPTAPSAVSPIPTTTAPVVPSSSPEQGSPEKTVDKGEPKDRPVTASKSPVKGGKKGKNTKKYGGFGTLAAYQDYLQREKDKEESKKRV
jgi:hypothetical protein